MFFIQRSFLNVNAHQSTAGGQTDSVRVKNKIKRHSVLAKRPCILEDAPRGAIGRWEVALLYRLAFVGIVAPLAS